MPETTPLIKAALNLRVGAGFDVYEGSELYGFNQNRKIYCRKKKSSWTDVEAIGRKTEYE